MGGISMIDGITIECGIENFEIWRERIKIQFQTATNISTGEIITKKREDQLITTHRGKWETFELEVKDVLNLQTGITRFYLKIKGSLHKNHFKGKNFQPFNWTDLQTQIHHISKSLLIEPNKARISTIEVGVNIVTPFEVKTFLKGNVINYKGKEFKTYKADKNGFELGLFCDLSQYKVKLYDKGLQNELPINLMRFEKRFLKMQILQKKGVLFLSDLLDIQKVKNLKPLIVEAWKNVLIYDIEDSKGLKKTLGSDYDLLLKGRNPRYWDSIKSSNRDRYNYKRGKFKDIVIKYGRNYKFIVLDLIKNEWNSLFINSTNLPIGECAELRNLTLKIKGKNVESQLPPLLNRVCLSCGKDISTQKNGSKFCSAKIVGEFEAHKCRNTNSNQRNNFKRKVEVIQGRGLLFDIMPFFLFNNKESLTIG
jgi:hypothetical protein